MNNEVFYFLVHPDGDKNIVKVVDLSYCCKYERDDFYTVNSEDFDDQEDAINYGKSLALKYNLTYEPFIPRYHCSTAEVVDEEFFLNDEEKKYL
jgi:hypothetical protein